ncbi:hypothetical protein FE257_003931 [Aspergillus nanangensis]|uniref:Arrestin-like N-terminal domain-containing protein n=1 Tax=Aspergillus nanangensis TaxID=2582783 RepID=A0AAD4CRQ3_ASPNN|nr:hypothetical protein FE257_003931 [Aspergillus nanangensis]
MKLTSIGSCSLASAFKGSNPKIAIELSDPKQRYTTWDQIEGTVTVTVDNETTFDDVDITFEGRSRAFSCNPLNPVRSSRVALLRPKTQDRETTTSHTFLKLQQPVEKDESSTSRTFIPGRTYTYLFTFIIPEKLPLGSCIHGEDNPFVHQRHGELPPSLRLKNLSQELCRISYLIRATVSRRDSGLKEVVATSMRSVHFIPTSNRQTLQSDIQNSVGCTKEQEVKKSKNSSSTLGQLTAVAPVSQLIQGGSVKSSSSSSMDTCVSVQLRFDPVGGTQPPQLRTLYSTFKASTVLDAQPNIRPLAFGDAPDSRYQGAHVTTTSLPSIDASFIQWAQCIEPRNTTSCTDGLYYTASINIPITLPKRDLLPTFHSCLISRSYSLDLNLSYRMPGTIGGHRAIKLQVPVEVGKAYDSDTSRRSLENTADDSKLSCFDILPPSYIDQERSGTRTTAPQRMVQIVQKQAEGLPGYYEVVS